MKHPSTAVGIKLSRAARAFVYMDLFTYSYTHALLISK